MQTEPQAGARLHRLAQGDRGHLEVRRRAGAHPLADPARGGEHLEGAGEIERLDAVEGQDHYAQAAHATARSSACGTVQTVAKRPCSTVAVRALMSAAGSGLPSGWIMSKVRVASVT